MSTVLDFVLDVVHFERCHYIIYGSFLIQGLLYFLLLWGAFLGKNWARWGGQEVTLPPQAAAEIARGELRSAKQLPQIWFVYSRNPSR